MSSKFQPLTPEEWEGSFAYGHVSKPYPVLVGALGEPHKNFPLGENPDYPDDDHKTDVSWGVKHESGVHLYVWNYKTGPAYNNGEGSIEELNYFSFGFHQPDHAVSEDEAERDFLAAIEGVKE